MKELEKVATPMTVRENLKQPRIIEWFDSVEPDIVSAHALDFAFGQLYKKLSECSTNRYIFRDTLVKISDNAAFRGPYKSSSIYVNIVCIFDWLISIVDDMAKHNGGNND